MKNAKLNIFITNLFHLWWQTKVYLNKMCLENTNSTKAAAPAPPCESVYIV